MTGTINGVIERGVEKDLGTDDHANELKVATGAVAENAAQFLVIAL